MRIFSWFVTFLILLLALGFTVKNQGSVTLSFWPFGAEISMPLALLSLGLLFLGFFFGSFMGWFGSLRYRFENKRLWKEVAALRDKRVVIPPARSVESVVPAPSLPKRKLLWFR
jgi:uncharacterized integral membrane protein